MSYGRELNLFRQQGMKYGEHWRALVLCHSPSQAVVAAEDAQDFLKGEYYKGLRLLKMPSGAYMRFRVVNNDADAMQSLKGQSYTHVIWLHIPESDELRAQARACLRSAKVPRHELQLEYATMR